MNASDILKYGDSFLQGALSGIPDSEWETEDVCGWWSAKNIVAHLASFEHMLCEVLTGFLGGGPTPTLDAHNADPQRFNDVEVDRRKGLSPSETLAEYNAAHARNMELIGQIPPEKLREPGTLPWYGMEYALDDFIVYTYYGHKREHGAQINLFKDTLRGR